VGPTGSRGSTSTSHPVDAPQKPRHWPVPAGAGHECPVGRRLRCLKAARRRTAVRYSCSGNPSPTRGTQNTGEYAADGDSGLSDVPDREMAAGTDAGVTPNSHAGPVLSVDRRDALGVEDRRVALVGSAGHMVG